MDHEGRSEKLILNQFSILRRVGTRELPGICQYPAKLYGFTVNQGGTANNYLFVLDRT